MAFAGVIYRRTLQTGGFFGRGITPSANHDSYIHSFGPLPAVHARLSSLRFTLLPHTIFGLKPCHFSAVERPRLHPLRLVRPLIRQQLAILLLGFPPLQHGEI